MAPELFCQPNKKEVKNEKRHPFFDSFVSKKRSPKTKGFMQI
jgi:hypothetical protein